MTDPGSQPPQCPCGFWGSESTAGLCSKCFKERQESADPNQASGPRTCSTDALRPSSSDISKRHCDNSAPVAPEKRLKLDTKDMPETTVPQENSSLNEISVTDDKLNIPNAGATISSSEAQTPSGNNQSTSAGFKKRCNECKLKLNPALREIGHCKCDKVYCQLHRLPEQHKCRFDHKAEGRKEQLSKMFNPQKHMGNNVERLQ